MAASRLQASLQMYRHPGANRNIFERTLRYAPYGWLSWSPFGPPKYEALYNAKEPQRDENFDNHPYTPYATYFRMAVEQNHIIHERFRLRIKSLHRVLRFEGWGRVVLYRSISYCITLYHMMLYYSILYYNVIQYIIPPRTAFCSIY